jgi:hypothetical protein
MKVAAKDAGGTGIAIVIAVSATIARTAAIAVTVHTARSEATAVSVHTRQSAVVSGRTVRSAAGPGIVIATAIALGRRNS